MAHSVFTIPTMDCPAEEAIIRRRFKSIGEVTELAFDLFNRRLTVTHSLVDEQPLIAVLTEIGMAPRASGNSTEPHTHESHGSCGTASCETAAAIAEPKGHAADDHRQDELPASRRELVLLGIAGVLAFAAEITSWITRAETSWHVIGMSIAAILLSGLPTLKKGLIAIRLLTLNINFLMSIAVIGAVAIGQWPEAAMVIFLFAVAELIENYSLERARNAVRSLMQIAPARALVQQANGEWSEVDAGAVITGAVVRVRPGERLPLDGVVVSGRSAVDQAPITGESVPVEKAAGDQVFAGTINQDGVLEFKTTGGKDDTTIARIVRTVQEAQGQRAPTQRFVDRFARVYTPIVVVIAALVALMPWLLFGQSFTPWLYNALVLLVIACPCALVISTPVTVVSGLAAAAKRGILVKGGVYLEQGRLLRLIAMDKTGTITEGRPKVTNVVPIGERSRDEVLRIAASLDALSDHPVAHAVAEAWKGGRDEVTDFRSVPGRGVEGSIGGTHFMVGNHRFAHERNVCSAEVEGKLQPLEAEGKTVIVVADDKGALGVLAVADTPRKSSVQAVQQLHGLGLKTLMLSGDNQRTAQTIAKTVGIDDARGELLPEDKLTAIEELLKTHNDAAVGMVGDGVNDAPALAKSSIGFAMGAAGTGTAIETADVALMQDDLRGVPEFIRLSRKTSKVLRQNITLALAIKAVFFGLALFGLATLWMAVIADMGASLLVVFNGLRLLRAQERNRD